MLTTVLPALTAMLTALAGILRLLTWLLLLAGLLLALVGVLRILAHYFLPWDPTPSGNAATTRSFRFRQGTETRWFMMSKAGHGDV